MNKIIVQSPTRVDLAGGTLDLWPLYNFTKGAQTINVAINVFTRVELTELADGAIELYSKDLQLEVRYGSLREALSDSDPRLELLRSQLQYWKPAKGLRLVTSSESPVGGGLGGSSSLTISLLKAFSQFCDRPFRDVHQMVEVAHNIEAQILNTPTGTQDYYPAASGGINILTYSADGIEQEVLPVANSVLAAHFMLVYTGKAHHSGINNFEVMKSAVVKDEKCLKALRDIKDIATATVQAVREKKWDLLPTLFKQEFEARVRLAPAFSSPEIEKLAQVCLQAGALAVKICGAGGGGCVLLWCPPQHQEGVRSACQKAGFQVMAATPVEPLT